MKDSETFNSLNSRKSKSIIENPSGYKVLILLSMLYMSIMICNAVLTNRYIGVDAFFVLGGTFTSPFVFILDDIIAEIYGFKITRFVIVSGFAAQTVFALIAELAVILPHPGFFHQADYYYYILGPSLLRIDIGGFAAYIIANLVNSYILSRWKVLLKGKKFWLRSIGSSGVSEALYTILAIVMMELKSIPLQSVIKVILISFLIKISYSFLFAWPATYLVNLIKRITGIDVYDFPKKFTPAKYSHLRENNRDD